MKNTKNRLHLQYQKANNSLHSVSGGVDIYEYRHFAEYSSPQEYKECTRPDRRKLLDKAWLRKNRLEMDINGRLRPLGNNANNVDKLSSVPFYSSAISSFNAPDYKPVRALNHAIKKEISSNRLAYERVHNCGCKTIGHDAEMFIDSRHNSARVASVETCGSVWACPVCAQKILKQRSENLKQIGEKWSEMGGSMYLLTLTFSHSKNDILADLIGSSTEKAGLLGAIGNFRRGRVWREFKKEHDYSADCRALEITYGKKSGFHPHVHFLIYTEKDIAPYLMKYWETKLYKNWALQCDKMGLGTPSREHGVDLRPARTEDYIAKWGSSCELSSGHVKSGRKNNVSIRQLQEFLVDDLRRSIYDFTLEKVKALLAVYNKTMKGNKLLTWAWKGSHQGVQHFRERLLGTPEKTDEELAKIQEDELQYLDKKLEIDSSSWQTIYWRGDSANIRSVLEKEGSEGVIEWGIKKGYDVSTWSICDLKTVEDKVDSQHQVQSMSRKKNHIIAERFANGEHLGSGGRPPF